MKRTGTWVGGLMLAGLCLAGCAGQGANSASTAPAANATGTRVPATDAWFKLGGNPALPSYLAGPPEMTVEDGGIKTAGRKYVHTLRTDFNNSDFVFDVVVQWHEGEGGICLVGIGDCTPRSYDEPSGAAYLRIHGSDNKGWVGLSTAPFGNINVGNLSKNPGKLCVRISKTGKQVTFAIAENFDGDFRPTLSKTIADIGAYQPKMNSGNSYLFFSGAGTYLQVRLEAKKTAIK